MSELAEKRGRTVKMDADQARRYRGSIQQLRETRNQNFRNLSKRVEETVLEFAGHETRLRVLGDQLVGCQKSIKALGGVRVLFKPPAGNRLSLLGPYYELTQFNGGRWLKRKRIKTSEINFVSLPMNTNRQELLEVITDVESSYLAYRNCAVTLETIEQMYLSALQMRRSEHSLLMAGSSNPKERLQNLPLLPLDALGRIEKLDEELDEAIHAFNEITVRRYGAFVARWKIPSQPSDKSLTGPHGPEFAYISWEYGGRRMLSPVHHLAKKVDKLKKRPERDNKKNVITKEMIQNSRFGKYAQEILAGHKRILALAEQRNSLINWARQISKHLM